MAELRAGTVAEPVPVMNDGSTFAIHGETRTFWVKLWHAAGTDLTKIDRAQVISCIPSSVEFRFWLNLSKTSLASKVQRPKSKVFLSRLPHISNRPRLEFDIGHWTLDIGLPCLNLRKE